MSFPKISIIIANYNNGHFFSDCYESLINQSETNWEAIVIDDSSTDDSVQVIKDKIKNDNRFKFFQNEKNIGYQKSLIKGIDLSISPIFGRLDPDDALTPLAIEKSVMAHESNPEVGLIHTNYIVCNEKMEPQRVHKGAVVHDFTQFYNLNWSITHFSTFKRNLYNKIGGIDTFNKRAEDQDLYMKMAEVAPVHYLDFDAYMYRVHVGGASTLQNSKHSFFWHWVAIIKAAERRNENIENLFYNYFVPLNEYDKLKVEVSNLRSSFGYRFVEKVHSLWRKLKL